jgi:hypothetical protein
VTDMSAAAYSALAGVLFIKASFTIGKLGRRKRCVWTLKLLGGGKQLGCVRAKAVAEPNENDMGWLACLCQTYDASEHFADLNNSMPCCLVKPVPVR